MTDFAHQLHHWYKHNKRELPWRNTKEPYKIWLSEIILQQTQVIQGTSYYHKFIDTYPTVRDLANASEDNVLKLWQGLGYYSRARNLHATAKEVCSKYNGIFPSDYKSILALKGIGPYTAAAISSICFSLPHAAVDGNVYRFLSRLYNLDTPIDTSKGQKAFTLLANELLNTSHPGDHNQAMMEFGALICRPSNPECDKCPFNRDCMALGQSTISELPIKAKKLKKRKRYFHYFFIIEDDHLYIQKREGNDIWKNLYQLPLIENDEEISPIEKINEIPLTLLDKRKHILSHQEIETYFYSASPKLLEQMSYKFLRVEIDDIEKHAFPQLIVDFFKKIKFPITDN